MRNIGLKTAFFAIGAFFLNAAVQAGGIEGTYDNGYLGDPESCPSLNVSDPVNVMTGNLFHKEPVYKDSGEFPLEFSWYYNSRSKEVDPVTGQYKYMGVWTYSYGQIAYVKDAKDKDNQDVRYVVVMGEDGSEIEFGPESKVTNAYDAQYPDVVGDTEYTANYGLNLAGGFITPSSERTLVKGNTDRIVQAVRYLKCQGGHVCSITGLKSVTRRRASDGVLEVYEFLKSTGFTYSNLNIPNSLGEQLPNTTALLVRLVHPNGQTHEIKRVIKDSGFIESMTVTHSNGRSIVLSEGSYRHYNLDRNKSQAHFNVLTVGEIAWYFRANTRIYGPRDIMQLNRDGSFNTGVTFDFGTDFLEGHGGGATTQPTSSDWESGTGMTRMYVRGQHIAGWRYDSKGRAVFAFHGPDADAPAELNYKTMTLADRFDDPLSSAGVENYDHHDRRSITNMLTGKKTTYQFGRITLGGVPRSTLTAISGAPTANCGKAGSVYSYGLPEEGIDASKPGSALPGQLKTVIDAKGFITSFKYHYQENSKKGRPYSKTIAVGTTQDSEIVYDWKSDAPQLLTKLDKPGLTTDITYTANNRIEDIIQTDTTSHSLPYSTNGAQRKWHYDYTYYDGAKGVRLQTKALTLPSGRASVIESYDERGHLVSLERKNIETGLSFKSRFTDFNDWGLPETIVNEQGVSTVLDYYRGVHGPMLSWVRRHNLDGTASTLSIDFHKGLELPSKISYPDGRWIKIYYVGEGTSVGPNTDIDYIENNLGDKIKITTTRRVTAENVFINPADSLKAITTQYITADGNVTFQTKQLFDALDRLYQEVRGTQSGAKTQTELNYDLNDNLQFFKQNGLDTNGTPLVITSELGFDALNQLASITAPDAGKTTIKDNQVTGSVTDAKERTTNYVYNGFGEPILIDSPDSGKTVYWYDEGGMLEKVVKGYGSDDAQETIYKFDGFGRIQDVTHSGPAFTYKSESYSYDYELDPDTGTALNASKINLNRLTRVIKGGGETGKDNQYSAYYYGYDEAGNVVSERIRLGRTGAVRATVYDYSKVTGNLENLTYPSGLILTPGYDALSRLNTMEVKAPNGSVKSIFSAVDYYPFGPVKTIKFGNALTETRTYNDAYQIDQIDVSSGIFLMDYGYTKGFGNIDSIKHTAANDDEVFTYDKAQRLKTATRSAYGSQAFDWSVIGDRDSQTLGSGGAQAINYIANTSGNEITIPAQYKRYVFDLRGNLLDDLSTATTSTNALYGYGPDNELLGVVNPKDKKIEVYCYNYKIERTCKERYPEKNRTNYYYNQAGQLLSENTGTSWRDYVYLGDMIVAMVDSNTTSPATTTVYYVHNNHLPAPTLITNENKSVSWQAKYTPFGRADIYGATMVNNIRLPGQYYDDITGLHYNHFRHYHPALGRYMQSDPIGLVGGVNTYGYALSNPVMNTDRDGLIVPLIAGYLVRAAVARAITYYATNSLLINEVAIGAAAAAAGFPTSPLATEVAAGVRLLAEGERAAGKVCAAADDVSEGIGFARSQLQHAFKHADDFGVTGNASNKTLAEYSSAIQSHITAPGTSVIQGTYRAQPVTHFTDPFSGLNVIRDASGNFLSGWKLSPQQLQHVMTSGKLGGG